MFSEKIPAIAPMINPPAKSSTVIHLDTSELRELRELNNNPKATIPTKFPKLKTTTVLDAIVTLMM